MASLTELVYLKKYYPEQFGYFLGKAAETEKQRAKELGRPFSVWSSKPKYNTAYKIRRVNEIIATEELQKQQISLFDNDYKTQQETEYEE